jgi:2-keto-4-pentenoate hydratase/2-oxohepta-3-ene-1,7-dioic acid hydratase in catechol pathway
MRIVGFEADGELRLGVIDGEEVVHVQAGDAAIPSDLGEVLRSTNGDLSSLSEAARRAPARARHALAGLKFGLPIARPGKIVCLGLNYLDHVKEGPQRDNIPKFPTIFMRCLTSLVPHGAPIIRPRVSETLDYEAELIAIVGRRARHLNVANACSCIAGYSCGNEGSVREFQRHTTQWTMGKNFDATGSFGPWMVTADELPVGGKGLAIQSRLNSQVMQSEDAAGRRLRGGDRRNWRAAESDRGGETVRRSRWPT